MSLEEKPSLRIRSPHAGQPPDCRDRAIRDVRDHAAIDRSQRRRLRHRCSPPRAGNTTGKGRNILDSLDWRRLTLLPNTAGCYNAPDAVRVANLGREILLGLENPGHDWVKLEVLGDPKTLLPDPIETLVAAEMLVKKGFSVLCYTNDDPVTARRLKNAGVAAVMPAGSPIGSGQGILNPNNIRIILETLKDGDPDYPVIVDAGVGTASDVAFAMELGVDGVLLNTAIAHARDPIAMGRAMKLACEAGRLAWLSGRIPKRLYAQASSPEEGVFTTRPWMGKG